LNLVESVEFDSGGASRCQSWKFQVSPGVTEAEPVGLGMALRSTMSEILIPSGWRGAASLGRAD
jgi:hypothetical protein